MYLAELVSATALGQGGGGVLLMLKERRLTSFIVVSIASLWGVAKLDSPGCLSGGKGYKLVFQE